MKILIFNKFSDQILNSNIKSLIYISTTDVYGNHHGVGLMKILYSMQINFDKMRVKSEKQWSTMQKKII